MNCKYFILFLVLIFCNVAVGQNASRQFGIRSGYNRVLILDDGFGPYKLKGDGLFVALETSWQKKEAKNFLQIDFWSSEVDNSINNFLNIQSRLFTIQYEKLFSIQKENLVKLWLGGGLSSRTGLRSENIKIVHVSGEQSFSLEFVLQSLLQLSKTGEVFFKIKAPVASLMVHNGIGVGDVNVNYGFMDKISIIQAQTNFDFSLSEMAIFSFGGSFFYFRRNINDYLVKMANEQYFVGLKFNIHSKK